MCRCQLNSLYLQPLSGEAKQETFHVVYNCFNSSVDNEMSQYIRVGLTSNEDRANQSDAYEVSCLGIPGITFVQLNDERILRREHDEILVRYGFGSDRDKAASG